MSPELLNLHISQLARTFEKSKTNKYADDRKQSYHDSLVNLFEKIKILDRYKLTDLEQLDLKQILDFCFLSIEFLDDSTLVNIPYEIVYCLEKALNEWDKTDRYIIVTSLQNNITCYSFNPTLALNEPTYDLIFVKFNIKFEQRLIQINLPRYLANDYLANVVLYHELGHFIDLRHQISYKIALKNKFDIKKYYHLGEFFSDVFAAQYIGLASNYYLNYIAHKVAGSDSHPSTDSRIKIVEDFLDLKTSNPDLNLIIDATRLITGNQLNINSDKIVDDDFRKFIPTVIRNEFQLHSVFEIGWQLWKTNVKEFEEKNIKIETKYNIINNLIEKSIGNHMITEKWNKYVPH